MSCHRTIPSRSCNDGPSPHDRPRSSGSRGGTIAFFPSGSTVLVWGRRSVRDRDRTGYIEGMKILRTAAAIGIAKKVYDEARKPENQRRIKEAAASFRSRQQGRNRPGR